MRRAQCDAEFKWCVDDVAVAGAQLKKIKTVKDGIKISQGCF